MTLPLASATVSQSLSQQEMTHPAHEGSHASAPAPVSTFRGASGYIAFAFLVSLYLLPFMRIVLHRSNEGTIIYGAERIVHGDVFARDFFEVMGPGSFYIVALFFRFFGVTFFATRVWLFCSSMGIALCMYFLGKRICARNAILPCLVLGGTWFGMQWPSVSHHVDSDLFSLLSVVCLVTWQERRYPLTQYAAGSFAGLTAWIHLPKGLLLIVALLSWSQCIRRSGAKAVVSSIQVLLGFLGVGVIGCVYFVCNRALGPLIYANITWPARNYGDMNTVPYALGIFSEYWHHWAALQGSVAGWPIALATTLIVPFLLVAVVPAALLLIATGSRSMRLTPTVTLCALAGWAIWLSEIHRRDVYHLAFGCPLLLIVGIGLLSDSKSRIVEHVLQLVTISAACLVTLNLSQVATAHGVSTRAGTVNMLRPEPMLQFVDAHTQPNEEVLFYPNSPSYYFLTGTRNPTRFSLLFYNYNTAAEFQEAVQVLEQKRVRMVVLDTSFDDRTMRAIFPGAPPTLAKAKIMEPYLQSRYKEIASLEGFQILLRNN